MAVCCPKVDLYVTTPPDGDTKETEDGSGIWHRPLDLSWWATEVEPAAPRKGASLDTLETRHRQYTKKWRGSIDYRKFQVFFQDVILKVESLQVTSCMCLCLGSLTWDTHCRDCDRQGPMAQLVAFESWIEMLKAKFDITHIYFQDPKFNDIDTDFLQSKGYEILTTPESDKYMTDSTFLFAPFGHITPSVSAINTAHPSLMVSTDLSIHRWFHILDEDTEIAHEAPLQRRALLSFLNQRLMKRMPKSVQAYWLKDHVIYYKAPSDVEIPQVDFDRADEELFPMVEDEARVLWERRKLEGGDLSGNRRDEHFHERTCEEAEGEDEWPVPKKAGWVERLKAFFLCRV